MKDVKPEIPTAGIIYGEIVYWLTIVGSVIAIIGATIATVGGDSYLDASIVFSAIWEGHDTAAIWQATAGELPHGHWYLAHLLQGDGLAMFGLALGVFSVTPALFASGVALIRNKQVLFGVLALVAVLLCITSFLGLIQVPE